MSAKIGLTADRPGDPGLIEELLELMHKGGADFTRTYRNLAMTVDGRSDVAFSELFREPRSVAPWLARWRERLSREGRRQADIGSGMQRVNPVFILRNHRVERAIDAAVDEGDFSKAVELHQVLANPFDDQAGYAAYREPPRPGDWQCKTFCGT